MHAGLVKEVRLHVENIRQYVEKVDKIREI